MSAKGGKFVADAEMVEKFLDHVSEWRRDNFVASQKSGQGQRQKELADELNLYVFHEPGKISPPHIEFGRVVF